MDLKIIREVILDENGTDIQNQDSGYIDSTYISKNMWVAVPYLTVIVLATISGTVGNVLVIGAVVVSKVSPTNNKR